MLTLFEIARFTSIISFLYYGISCISSKRMVAEFERFGLPQFRAITGVLQIFASIGLIVGIYSVPIFLISAGGLALQMCAGVAVRIKIKDSIQQTAPALFFMFLNAYLFAAGLIYLKPSAG